MTARGVPPRPPLMGVRQILRFNRRKYGLAFTIGATMLVAGVVGVPSAYLSPWAIGLGLLTLLGTAWTLFMAFAIYDASPLYDWTWWPIPETSRAITVIHAGLDEASPALATLHPGARLQVLDIYDRDAMTEPAIVVARQGEDRPEAADFRALPVADGSADAVVLFFAAHELRKRGHRVVFLREVRRILSPAGRVVLVEHHRDGWNLLAFGPGAVHFLSRREWEASVAESGLRIERRSTVTPFVHVWELGSAA